MKEKKKREEGRKEKQKEQQGGRQEEEQEQETQDDGKIQVCACVLAFSSISFLKNSIFQFSIFHFRF